MTLCALLISAALVLSYFERFLPLQLLIPLPGMKLGLANVVSLMALFFWGWKEAFVILILRCTLGAFFGGSISGLLFSLAGGILSMTVMGLCSRYSGWSVYGISVMGAAAHNVGQIGMAVLWMRSVSVVGYLPYLLIVSIFTGLGTGATCAGVFRILYRIGQVPEGKKERNV